MNLLNRQGAAAAFLFGLLALLLYLAGRMLEPFGGVKVVLFGDLFQLSPPKQMPEVELLNLNSRR